MSIQSNHVFHEYCTESDEIRARASETFSMESCKAIAKLGILYFSSTLVYAVFLTADTW